MIEWIIIGIVALLVLIAIFYYNRFVVLSNRIDNSLSQIDVQLKRRADLIPNLIEAVKGYSNYEKDTLTKITEARTKAINASGFENKVKAENKITETLKSLFAVSENYPDLKANQNFLQLQEELSDTEDKISASRRFYNGAVKTYNTKIESIPTNIVANIFKFKAEKFWEIENEIEKENIKVKI